MPLGAGTYSPYAASFRDKGGEVSTFRVFGLPMSEEDYDTNQAARVAFTSALDGACLGVLIQSDYGGELSIVNPVTKASSASAQRENKLLVRYYDSVTFAKLTASIPTIDLPQLVFETDARDFVSQTTPAFIVTLKSTWQAFVVNPETGNLTLIDSLEFIGRNT